MRIKLFALSFVLCSSVVFAQVTQQSSGPNSPNINGAGTVTINHDIVVKPSLAEDSLVEKANQMESITKAYNDLLQQARTNLDTKNKPIVDEMKARSKKWQDKIDADTKDLKAQLEKNQADAQAQFQRETAGLTAKAVSPQTMTALEEIVKKEQDLPATAHFDLQQKKWVDPAKK